MFFTLDVLILDVLGYHRLKLPIRAKTGNPVSYIPKSILSFPIWKYLKLAAKNDHFKPNVG
jgi:hypothetical protein